MIRRGAAPALAVLLAACGPTSEAPAAVAARAAPVAIPVYGYEVVRAYPHDPAAFTQGLFHRDGFLYESTGHEGRSTVRKVRPETGEVLQKWSLPPQHFGEGITDVGDRIVGLTWTSGVGFELDLKTFSVRREFTYPGEGWGITRLGGVLVVSDGSSWLRFWDAQTLQETGRVRVTAEGRPVDRLNELEAVDGEIFANVWQTDRIARIDPKTGRVTGWIELDGLLQSQGPVAGRPDVLNGIAYDAAGRRLFVTGKWWPKLFEIRLVPKPAG